VNSDGDYWLDPTQDAVIDYLAGIIQDLSEQGFEEVILNQFYFPSSDEIEFDTGDSTRSALLARAYDDLVDATVEFCDIGLLITDPNAGHQAIDEADRIYVYFNDGSMAKAYAETRPDQYLVYITDSHDTRFDDYGKLTTDQALDLDPVEIQLPEETEDDQDDEADDEDDEAPDADWDDEEE
jgi:hypothetical protein